MIPTDNQVALSQRPVGGRLFLEGPAGAGKTTAGVLRMLHILGAGVAGRSRLIAVPQRTLAAPYYEALRRPSTAAGGQVTVSTVGGLAQQMVGLFWPLVAEEAGFAHPRQPPTFLTLETAQYYMARLVRPLLDQGYFESVVIDRNRIYSQIIDSLNKAAVVGFSHAEIGPRLRDAWGGEPGQRRIYDEAHACAARFREYCLAHNLLDFSLQLDVFARFLWPLHACRDYLLSTHRHLIVDNVEEDTPVAHDILREWLASCESALVIADQDAGYRRFLGADPDGGMALAETCAERVRFNELLVTSPAVRGLERALSDSLGGPGPTGHSGRAPSRRGPGRPSRAGDASRFRDALAYETHRYYPQTLDWVSREIARLIHEDDVAPAEIVVLAPYLSDRLRFSLGNRLEARGIAVRSHRPSRALREEPAARCLLTIAALAHPNWAVCPSRSDVTYALLQAIEELDLVRAQLLTEIVYRATEDRPSLSSFDHIIPEMRERLTYTLGERYERLRLWISDYAKLDDPARARDDPSPAQLSEGDTTLDHFFSRLFGEVLSQPGFGFRRDYDAAAVAATLIESARKFRWATEEAVPDAGGDAASSGREYVAMVQEGVIAAQYIRGWHRQPQDAVLLAPAYTFLMQNRPVDYQFWLDVGGRGWWERLYQPLTHPYVLSRQWPRGETWSDAHEVETRQQALRRLTLGLVRRCRRQIYLGLSELDEQGNDQRGPLLQAIQRALRQAPGASDSRAGMVARG